MAITGSTFYYGIGPSQQLENVVEGYGSAPNSSFLVELFIAAQYNAVTDSGAPGVATSRAINKSEVILALELLTEQIIRDTSGKFD